MDERKRLAAQVALGKIEHEKLMQRIELHHRQRCISDVSFFLLPYRLLHDLHQPDEYIQLSRFYPHQAIGAETEKMIEDALQAERERYGEVTPEVYAKIRAEFEPRDWTPQDKREYYFTPFLSGQDFSSYKTWDWTGETVSAATAAKLKKHYLRRQGEFEDHPERYCLPVLKADDAESYYSPRTWELLQAKDELLKGCASVGRK